MRPAGASVARLQIDHLPASAELCGSVKTSVSLSDENVWGLWLFLEGVGPSAPEPEPGEPAGFQDRCCSEAWMTPDPRSCRETPEVPQKRNQEDVHTDTDLIKCLSLLKGYTRHHGDAYVSPSQTNLLP